MTREERNLILLADDSALMQQCELIMQKGTGNGGQKINKTSSAVRLRHKLTGLAVAANEHRSQSQNRHIALNKLRLKTAFSIRTAPDFDFSLEPLPSPANASRLIPWIADVFDHAEFCGWDLVNTASSLLVSASKLEKSLRHYPDVWKSWCEHRNALSPDKPVPSAPAE